MNSNPDRISSIDQFRGTAILAMVLANFIAGIEVIPAWLKHANDIGYTVVDLIAPLFIFAIGLTFERSFQQRCKKYGVNRAATHFVTRYLALIGLGAVISMGETSLGIDPGSIDWGVLQAIGVAGLFTLAVIWLKPAWRVLVGIILLGLYQFFLDHFWLDTVLRSSHGGFFGSLSWAAMLILATVLADFFHSQDRQKRLFPWMVALTLVGGWVLTWVIPLSKNRVSASYILFSLGASGLLFFFYHFFAERFHLHSQLLQVWGKNPLALYLLHFLFIGIFYLPGIPSLYVQVPLWLAVLETTGLIGFMTLCAWWMYRRGIVFSL